MKLLTSQLRHIMETQTKKREKTKSGNSDDYPQIFRPDLRFASRKTSKRPPLGLLSWHSFFSVQRQMAHARSFIKPERHCILQIHRIKAVATSIMTTMCQQKRTEYSRGPFLAAMFLLVFWILFWGPWWSKFVGIRGAPRLTEACPRHAWQELLWKKPPLRTSTCGRHRFRRNHPLWEPSMWQGQVWEARPDGESTRGKAKFGKRHGSRKWEEENSSTRRRHRGKGRKRQKTPSPPYNVPHTPLGIRRAGCFLLLCISQTPEMHPRPFFWGFWHPQWSFARVLPHAQGHPQASARALADMWLKMAAFPDLALRRCCLAEIARACNHSSWFKFSSSQYPLENYKLRNMVRFRAPASTSAIL